MHILSITGPTVIRQTRLSYLKVDTVTVLIALNVRKNDQLMHSYGNTCRLVHVCYCLSGCLLYVIVV